MKVPDDATVEAVVTPELAVAAARGALAGADCVIVATTSLSAPIGLAGPEVARAERLLQR